MKIEILNAGIEKTPSKILNAHQTAKDGKLVTQITNITIRMRRHRNALEIYRNGFAERTQALEFIDGPNDEVINSVVFKLLQGASHGQHHRSNLPGLLPPFRLIVRIFHLAREYVITRHGRVLVRQRQVPR